MDWFLYERDLRHEKVKDFLNETKTTGNYRFGYF